MRQTVATTASRRVRSVRRTRPVAKVIVAVVAALVVGAISSCAAGPEPVDVPAQGAGFYREPPEVRLQAAGDAPGLLVYQHWVSDGQWYEERTELVPEELPLARLSPGAPLVFHFPATGAPAWADLSLVAEVGADGSPVGDPERITCVPLTGGMPCWVEFAQDRDRFEITVRPELAGGFAALNLGWHRSVAAGAASAGPDAPSEVSATWAFAFSWATGPPGPR